MLNGIDISYSNTKDGTWADFAIIKATEALGTDPLYHQHVAAWKRAHKPFGAYCFGRGDAVASSEQQARDFLQTVGSDTKVLALDVERSAHPMTNNDARQFIAEVHRHGFRIGLYKSESVFFDAGQDWNWIAHYGMPASYWPHGADIFQWHGSPLDRNRFRGTVAQFLALGTGIVVPPPPPPVYGPLVPTGPASTEGNAMIAEGGITVTSSHVKKLAKGQPLFRYPGGPRVTAMSTSAAVPYIGSAGGGWQAVQVTTAAPYADKIGRRTVLYVPATAGPVEAI